MLLEMEIKNFLGIEMVDVENRRDSNISGTTDLRCVNDITTKSAIYV